VKSCVRTAF